MTVSSKVLVIGLDGATLDLLGPWMRDGLLPCLSTFQTDGMTTTLESVVPPQTASGWSSLITGKNPGRHGIFGFVKRDPKSYDLLPISASDRKSLDLWEILNSFGKKVGVLGVPVTYPVRKVDGFLISGLLTPYGVSDYYYPEGLIDELVANVGSFNPPYTVFGGKEDVFLEKLYDSTENHAEVTKYLMQKKEWNFFMTVFYGTDKVQHTFWQYLDPNNPRCDPKKREKYKDAILRYYQRLDEIVSDIIRLTDDETTTFIVSDHGAEPLFKWVHPNVFLTKEGLLKIRRGIVEQTRYLLFRMGLTPSNALKLVLAMNALHFRKRLGKKRTRRLMVTLFTSLKDVDWTKSKAYSIGGWGRIFINLKGRDPEGIVEPGKQYETVRSDIIRRLESLVDPKTGEKLCTQSQIFKKEDIYNGPYIEEAPDIVFQLRPGYLSFPGYEFGSNSLVSDLRGWSAGHAMNGILMMKGRNVKKGAQVADAKMIDVAPTVLAMMGLPLPADMDGRVLTEALSPEFLESHKIRKADYSTQLGTEYAYTEEQTEQLKQALKALGYL